MTILSPDGFYDTTSEDGFANLNDDAEDDYVFNSVGVVPPVSFIQADKGIGETLGDFTRRMYGANTLTGRERIANANFGSKLEGVVNVPI